MMASPDTDPPAYSESAPDPRPRALAGADPPTYHDAADARPTDQLPTSELFNLVLDNCLIYHSTQPDRPLYELSYSPTSAQTAACAVQKFIYKDDGEGSLRNRTRHLYDFRTVGVPHVEERVQVTGQSSTKFAFKDVAVQPGRTGSWAGTCRAEGHFKAEQGVRGKVKDEVSWKNEEGREVAVETKLKWKKEKSGSKEDKVVDRRATLEVKRVMETRSLDLLVTLWVVRVWKESQKDQAEPFSWGKCKLPAIFPMHMLNSQVIGCNHDANQLDYVIVKRVTSHQTSGSNPASAGGFL